MAPVSHLHVDPLGGVAGDMFVAALSQLVDSDGLLPLLRSAGLEEAVGVSFCDHRDDVFCGRRFVVEDPREQNKLVPGRFVLQQGAPHAHLPHRVVVERIGQSALSAGAKARALDIFARLATAEAAVHGVPLVDVAFHEVGAQDSIADVVAAAVLLDRLGPVTCSTSSLPLGAGRVQTAHGELPLPAPASLRMLEGLPVHDDGRLGERLTPTGLAILTHLQPQARRPAGVVGKSGIGFGTKVFPGIANILRLTLTSTPSLTTSSINTERLLLLECEIDDMTAEELARAAEGVRAEEGVVDVVSCSVFMKKGRVGTRLSVSCRPAVREAVTRAVFLHTSTLGVRVLEVERAVLAREERSKDGVRTKIAKRPGGETKKADIDDVPAASLAELRKIRGDHEAP